MHKGTLADTFAPYRPANPHVPDPRLRSFERQTNYRSLACAMRWALNMFRLTLETDPEQIEQSAHFADQPPQPWDLPDYWQHEREERFKVPLPTDDQLHAILGHITMECPYLIAIFNSALHGDPCMESIRPLRRTPENLPEKLRAYKHEASRTVNMFNSREAVVHAIRMLDVAAQRIEELERQMEQLEQSNTEQ